MNLRGSRERDMGGSIGDIITYILILNTKRTDKYWISIINSTNHSPCLQSFQETEYNNLIFQMKTTWG